jgi:hypothetical protein
MKEKESSPTKKNAHASIFVGKKGITSHAKGMLARSILLF